jgi:hypothetical protein
MRYKLQKESQYGFRNSQQGVELMYVGPAARGALLSNYATPVAPIPRPVFLNGSL